MFRFHHGDINQKLLTLLSCLILVLAPTYSYSAGQPWDYDYQKAYRWAVKWASMSGDTSALSAYGQKKIIENGSARTIQATAAVRTNAIELGGVMKRRLNFVASGGAVGLLGVAALQGLLEGIGWVMKEGTYVKVKPPSPDCKTCYPYIYEFAGKTYANEAALVAAVKKAYSPDNPNQYTFTWQGDTLCGRSAQGSIGCPGSRRPNPLFVPNQQGEEVSITEEQIGCAMLGTCYKDPVDPSIDPRVNDGVGTPPIVIAAATPEEKIGEDDLTNPISKKANDALNAAAPDVKSDGTKGTSTTINKPDPDNPDETKTEGEFQIPAFCEWAAAACIFFESTVNAITGTETNTSNTAENTRLILEEMKKEEQSSENQNAEKLKEISVNTGETAKNTKNIHEENKTFYQRAVEFFDWFDEEPPTDTTDSQLDFDEDPDPRPVTIAFGGVCPQPISIPINLLFLKTTMSISFEWPCTVAQYIKPVVIGFSSYIGVLIVAGIRTEE